jgi:uncharacterized membrane protein
MSNPNTLVALVFDDPYKADEARAALLRMAGEGMLTIDETAVLSRKSEKEIRVTQDADLAAKGKGIGRIVGAVASSVIPLAVPLGAAIGGRIADAMDKGISNSFVKDVQKELQDGTSVLILMVRDSREHSAEIVARVRQFNARILQSELSPYEEAALAAALTAPS